MSVILVFLVVVLGFAGWWLAHQRLMSKPWLEVGPDPIGGPGPTGMPTQKIALGIFLAVVGALFALFASAYFMRMEFADWRPMPMPRIVWLNTGMLVLASVALECALAADRQRDVGHAAPQPRHRRRGDAGLPRRASSSPGATSPPAATS